MHRSRQFVCASLVAWLGLALVSGPGVDVSAAKATHKATDPVNPHARELHRPGSSFENFQNLIKENRTDELAGTFPRWVQRILAMPEHEQLAALAEVRGMVSDLIIGSGTSMLAAELGAEIDKFPRVYRFNRFELKGYEKHVGSKTSVWVLNQSDLNKKPRAPAFKFLNNIGTVFTYVPSSRSKNKALETTRKVKGLKKKLKIIMWTARDNQVSKQRYAFTGDWFSTGTITVLRSIGSPPVGYYGFDFGKGSHGHYFKQITSDTCHNLSGEGFVMQQLERDGALVRLPCLVAKSTQEIREECAVSKIFMPRKAWAKGCKLNSKGKRTDVAAGPGGPTDLANLPVGGIPRKASA